MKKIVTNIQPFVLKQNFYIFNDAIMVDGGQYELNNAATSLLDIAQSKNVKEIHLQGNQFYAIKLKEEILEKRLQFSKNNIDVIIEE